MLKTKIKTIKNKDSKEIKPKGSGYDIQKVDFKNKITETHGVGTITTALYAPTKFFPIRYCL